MKTKTFALPVFFVLLWLYLLTLTSPNPAAAFPSLPPSSPESSSAILFIENVGQFDEHARFQVQGGSGTMWLAEDALWLTLLAPATDMADDLAQRPDRYNSRETEPQLGVNIKLSFVGANATPELQPFNRRETSVNYFIGNESDGWHTDVPVWGGVRYAELYPGLDLELVSEWGDLRPRLVCYQNCQTALQQVRLQVDGAESFRLVDGQLTLTTPIGDFVLPSFVFVMNDRNSFSTLTLTPHLGNNTITFLASNPHHPTPIFQINPPGLVYSTFLGGNSYDNVSSIVVDQFGNAYLTGTTYSTNFPTTPGSYDPTHNGGTTDAIVLKINPDGSNLVYATFLGATGYDDGNAIAIDSMGNAVIAGYTSSPDFPVTSGVFDPTHNGMSDVFVASLNSTGSNLIYATFLGGARDDYINDFAQDEMGNTYVTGTTESVDFPMTPGTYDSTLNGYMDAFVAKLNVSASNLVYATFLGGDSYDGGHTIAPDGMGNAYISGLTVSVNFPSTPGVFDPTYNGPYPYEDGFIVKLNPTGSNLVFASFLGGTHTDYATDIAVDELGHAYIVGFTFSADFPTTPGTFDTTFNGGNNDIFVVKFNPMGSDLIYGTFIGEEYTDWGFGITVDDAGNAYVAGYTSSINYPTTPDAFDTTYNGGHDATLTVLDPGAQDLIYSTFLGAGAEERGGRIVQDGMSHVYYVGSTESVNFPTTPGAFDTTFNGGQWDSFLVKLALGYTPVEAGFSGSPTSGIAPLPVAFTNLSTGDFDTCLWDFGDGATSPDCNAPNHTYETAGSYTVTLAISGLGGSDTVSQPAFITVYEPVQADFAAAPTSGHPPLLVQFTNLASGDFTNCLWEFGDGATSTECNNPVHTYEVLGTYTVMLTVSGSGGIATETKTDYIVVDPNLFFLPLLRSADE